ncbi:MAG TPA: ABC transporter permease subunit [Anaerolineales bacterium]|nr:ABC transporter permease subunit [Anaerolineales bacterium]
MKPSTGNPWRRLARSIGLVAALLLALVIYAYGFEVTQVDLEETRSETRQTQLVRILRAIAQPEIIEFPQSQQSIDAPFFMPCPPTPWQLHEPNPRQPYLLVTPNCTEPGGRAEVRGFNFEPGSRGNVFLIPPSQVTLRLSEMSVDREGNFSVNVQLPERSSDQVQTIRAIVQQNTGTPRFTRTAHDTWDKIIETVFLALLATTLSTIIAVPLSFLAARNLMKGIRSSLLAISVSLLAIPVGVVLGNAVARFAGLWGPRLATSMPMNVAGVVVAPFVVWAAARWALPAVEPSRPPLAVRLARPAALAAAAVVGIFGIVFLAKLLLEAGTRMAASMGDLAFLGHFIFNLGEILEIGLGLGTALAGAGIASSLSGRLVRTLTPRLPAGALRLVEILAAAAAGALLLVGIGATVEWLYRIGNPVATLYVPAAVGALIGLAMGVRFGGRDTLPVGLVIYAIARTVFNGLRSIEALIMVIVFAVWVGIGPFAGVLALSLHSVAALAKLYSEQVESILPGPLEAITATGATRMQTIVYAVVPQIIPPYISFTMYRWDINVRMSTIIGFAGGGGIGFLLQQNINLLNYRAASAQMLAIAIVVAAMDYISSALRERVV